MYANVTQPQPHGSYLVAHLAALPSNHVLKLLSRHHTLWGEILESIVTLCLVRDSNGKPDYILLLSTPVRKEQIEKNRAPSRQQLQLADSRSCWLNFNPFSFVLLF
jgi:hypothetical protein